MILHHITFQENIHSILTMGLKINPRWKGFHSHTDTRSKRHHDRYNTHPIFLTSDTQHIIDTQLGQDYLDSHKMYVLDIDASNLQLEYEYQYLIDIDAPWIRNQMDDILKTYISKEDIPLDRIVNVKRIQP
jgi:hypothetical protein